MEKRNPFLAENRAEMMTSEEWRKKEDWMRELMDASNDGFWEWNVASGSVYFSGRWASMLGYNPDDIEPHVHSWEKLVHPDDLTNVMQTLQGHLDGKTPYYQTEHRLLCKDGSWRWILDRGRVVERTQDGKPLRAAGAHIDITRQKQLEIEKDAISRGRVEILAVVSHELKNPIHAILSAVEFLKRRMAGALAGENQARDREVFDSMSRAVNRMNNLVNDLLLTTRLESGAPLLNFDKPRPGQILQRAEEGILDKAGVKNINIELLSPPEVNLIELKAEGSRLVQVLANLIENAVKFSPVGGRIRIGARLVPENPSQVEFWVEDSGPGVPELERKKIFQRFWQARSSSYQGTGLGLYIADGIIKAHGGQCVVEGSSLGGALFKFLIPIQTPKADFLKAS